MENKLLSKVDKYKCGRDIVMVHFEHENIPAIAVFRVSGGKFNPNLDLVDIFSADEETPIYPKNVLNLYKLEMDSLDIYFEDHI